MAEMGFTRKEIRRLEKQRLIRSKLVVEFCISSWCLMVVTTSRLQRIPKKESAISSKTQYTTFMFTGLSSSNPDTVLDEEEEEEEMEEMLREKDSVGIMRYIQNNWRR